LLARVERPSRYLNHEYRWSSIGPAPATVTSASAPAPGTPVVSTTATNAAFTASAAPAPADYRAVFLYPDTYEIGQANQAIAILHHIADQLPGVCAERAFLPWLDMIALMRAEKIPLFSLETARPLATADLLGITLPHELALTNVLEALDLAGLPLFASERDDAPWPLLVGGGPLSCNPEPIADFFDVIAIGEGEELIGELITAHRRLRDSGVGRAALLRELAGIEGVYVPRLTGGAAGGAAGGNAPSVAGGCAPDAVGGAAGGSGDGAASDGAAPFSTTAAAAAPTAPAAPQTVRKRVLANLDAWPVITDPLVPYAEVAHDRLNVEILRGCVRGCRFCQAGMAYRPVRERQADTIVAAVERGLACTGYDEVSLTSLSSTDHSQIEPLLRRLRALLAGRGISVSLPSQRLDAFGVAMAHLVKDGARRTGLTFAPEAGSQRLRDVINKNVTQDDLLAAVRTATAAGWRRCKLYYMIGLPTETDDDIRAITELTNLAYRTAKESVPDEQRSQVRLSVSVAVFVPKAQTPFQWQGQIARDEAERRIALLRTSGLHKGIDLHWHDPATSQIEAVFSRSGRETAALVLAAWRAGALFDAWSERFSLAPWEAAADELGLSLQDLASRDYALDEPLPWDHIDFALEKEFLAAEAAAALAGKTTSDCSFAACNDCGVCGTLRVGNVLGRHRLNHCTPASGQGALNRGQREALRSNPVHAHDLALPDSESGALPGAPAKLERAKRLSSVGREALIAASLAEARHV
jgi:radical SAM superfamily enzyme YgiQ (UPF0313 family)